MIQEADIGVGISGVEGMQVSIDIYVISALPDYNIFLVVSNCT
jgi:magnesium-transporting ATPase (P-type)